MTDKPKYVATLKIEKVTPKRGSVGFSNEELQDERREEVIAVKLSSDNLSTVKSRISDHLDITEDI